MCVCPRPASQTGSCPSSPSAAVFFCHFFIFQATILISGGKRAPSGSESSERERRDRGECRQRTRQGLGPRQRNGSRHVARFILRQAPYDFQSRGKTVSDRVCVQSRQELRVHDDRGLWNRRSRVRDAAEGAGQAHRSGQLLSHLLHLPFRGHADHGVSVIGLELFFFSTLFFFRTPSSSISNPISCDARCLPLTTGSQRMPGRSPKSESPSHDRPLLPSCLTPPLLLTQGETTSYLDRSLSLST